MSLFIGIDLGTSAAKLLLTDERGVVRNIVTREYPLLFPHDGWSEQDPAEWRRAVWSGIPELLRGFDASEVAAIGAAGQMHGLVTLDGQDRVLRPAILWNDGRTAEQTAWLNDTVGRAALLARTGNIAFAGFTAPKLLWMRKHEPERFARIEKIMLPKDYVNYCLTGVHASDFSDASGTLLLDVEHRRWSPEMLELCGVSLRQMPRLCESWEVIGTLLPGAAAELGLPQSVHVVAGAGDNAAAAVGTGTVGDGGCTISLGTSGTIFVSAAAFRADHAGALHAFAHADGGWHLMGCMLSAASCYQWLCRNILRTDDCTGEEAAVRPEDLGRNRVFFLPYLMGERSPINDTAARGTFIGMTLDTARADLVQAVLEGVAFAMRDSCEIALGQGVTIGSAVLCGGGSRSALWRRIFANVLGIPILLPKTEQGPGFGAAMLAMVGCGVYPDVRSAAGALVSVKPAAMPEPELTARYEAAYRRFRLIYPACRTLFPRLAFEEEKK